MTTKLVAASIVAAALAVPALAAAPPTNDVSPAIKHDVRHLKEKAKRALHRADVRMHRDAARARARARQG